MSHYKCNQCEEVSSEEELESKTVSKSEYQGRPVGEDTLTCPICHSDDLTELFYCDSCEEPFEEEKLTDGLCKDCI